MYWAVWIVAFLLAMAVVGSPLMLGIGIALAAAWVGWRVLRTALRQSWSALRPVPKAELSPSARRLLDRLRGY
jgi:hypothetical protein